MRVLDLFSGIGGMALGLSRAGMDISALCEIDPYCRLVLEKHWPDIPIYHDVKDITKERLDADGFPVIDLLAGGFPCQPYSNAGERDGAADDRDLWPEMHRVIKAIRPRWIIAENVTGFLNLGIDQVISDLADTGYAWWAFVLPAVSLNAWHVRERVWIVAYADSQRLERQWPDSDPQGWQEQIMGTVRLRSGNEVWDIEPDIQRVVDGLSARMDRLKAIGNAVVPQIPQLLGQSIMDGYEFTSQMAIPTAARP